MIIPVKINVVAKLFLSYRAIFVAMQYYPQSALSVIDWKITLNFKIARGIKAIVSLSIVIQGNGLDQ